MEEKASTDSLLYYIKWYKDKYHKDVEDRVKLHVLEMYCANGNPNFKLFGRVIKRLFKNNEMEKMKEFLQTICTTNRKDFFGDMEGTFEDLKAQANLNDEDAVHVRNLIHKNTKLNNAGKFSNNSKQDKEKKKSQFDKLHMFRSSNQSFQKKDDTDTNSDNTEDSFIDKDSGSESGSDDGSYENDTSSSDDEKEMKSKKRKR